jgi:hypothetical protein
MSDIKSMVDAVSSGDMASANNIFNGIMADKVSQALDAKRVEVAQNLYNEEQLEMDLGDENEFEFQAAED